MRRPLKAWAVAVLLLAPAPALPAGEAGAFFSGLDAMKPEERYRQLSLMLMVSDGADQALVDALGARREGLKVDPAAGTAPDFDFDDYTTPLIRIVDQESMLAGALRLFHFTREHAAAIAERLGRLQEDHGDRIGAAFEHAIAEDAIIIRNAIADSIDYAALGLEAEGAGLSQDYRARTIRLRNNLEYELFTAELERITQEAVASVGGQTDAYERMFEEEVDAAALDKKIKAAEYAYGWDRDFDERAARLAEEILNNIWDRESDLDP